MMQNDEIAGELDRLLHGPLKAGAFAAEASVFIARHGEAILAALCTPAPDGEIGELVEQARRYAEATYIQPKVRQFASKVADALTTQQSKLDEALATIARLEEAGEAVIAAVRPIIVFHSSGGHEGEATDAVLNRADDALTTWSSARG